MSNAKQQQPVPQASQELETQMLAAAAQMTPIPQRHVTGGWIWGFVIIALVVLADLLIKRKKG